MRSEFGNQVSVPHLFGLCEVVFRSLGNHLAKQFAASIIVFLFYMCIDSLAACRNTPVPYVFLKEETIKLVLQ